MKTRFKNFLSNCFNGIKIFIAGLYFRCREKIRTSYVLCREGEETLKNLLLYWCIVPMIIYIFIVLKIGMCHLCKLFFDFCAVVISALDLFFIQKSLKKHPEYDSEFLRETEREAYYASLSSEELKKVKSDERKKGIKNFVKRMLLITNGDRVDSYKIVRLFMLLMLLIASKRLLL
jgi:hypothetical protein